ncbi:Macrophage mannose receptor 1 [Clarias magur]|uniref:Macrophage mannose receptor 1 n=1 Tax=Clarias magur TaxID=1594786 RepID=A0A8J4TSC3_CLAMG|nr:Macrophage mannose receptor 1 [Clarias magur]
MSNKRLERFSNRPGLCGRRSETIEPKTRKNDKPTRRLRKKDYLLSAFRRLMRQEGQKQRSAHVRKPPPCSIPNGQTFKPRPSPSPRNGVEGNIVSKRAIKRFRMPSEPRGLHGTRGKQGGKSQLPPLSLHDLPPRSYGEPSDLLALSER